MQITTMHTLAFTFRAANGRYAVAAEIITISTEVMGLDVVSMESLPLPDGETPSIRNTKVMVRCDDHDKLELYWNQLQPALGLVGVEATSP